MADLVNVFHFLSRGHCSDFLQLDLLFCWSSRGPQIQCPKLSLAPGLFLLSTPFLNSTLISDFSYSNQDSNYPHLLFFSILFL